MEINPLNNKNENCSEQNKVEEKPVKHQFTSIWAANDKDGIISEDDICNDENIQSDAFGSLKKVALTWLRTHSKQNWTEDLANKFDKYMKSGTAARFFYGDYGRVNEDAYNEADKNKDGTVSLEEMREYLNFNVLGRSTEQAKSLILKIAGNLGISILDNGKADFYHLQSEIKNTLNGLIEADNGSKIIRDKQGNIVDIVDTKDNIVELLEVMNGRVEYKNSLYRTFGIADGNIRNRQGNIGDCWLLVAQASLREKQPELYNKLIHTCKEGETCINDKTDIVVGDKKTPEIGDVVIKFQGAKEAYNGKIPTIIVSREEIMQEIKNSAKRENGSYRNGDLYGREGGSTDPDSIALEIGYKKFLYTMNEHIPAMKLQRRQDLESYLINSEPVAMDKPSTDNMKDGMSYYDLRKIYDYIYFCETTGVNNNYPEFPEIDQDTETIKFKAGEIEKIKEWIKNSKEPKMKKPQDINDNSSVYEYLYHSEPKMNLSTGKSYAKPDIEKLDSVIRKYSKLCKQTSLDGGHSHVAIQMLTGFHADNYYEKEDIESVLNSFKDKDKESITYLSFKENIKSLKLGLHPNHAYYIYKVDGDNVYIKDSHNSETIRCINNNIIIENAKISQTNFV